MKRMWYVLAGSLAGIGLIIGSISVFSGSFSPQSYIAHTYQRAASRDIGRDARAYVTGKSPSLVAGDLISHWAPAGRFTDGSGVYLRYSGDSVVLKPNGSGTLILVESLRTSYRRYAGVVGGSGWVGRGQGITSRGGGPGTGK